MPFEATPSHSHFLTPRQSGTPIWWFYKLLDTKPLCFNGEIFGGNGFHVHAMCVFAESNKAESWNSLSFNNNI